MGLTRPRAYQIFDLDYKQAVRAVATSNITLSGGAPSLVDGVTLALNDRVLVTGQSTGSQNGIYYVTTVGTGSNGTWARSVDGDQTGEILAGMIIMVTEGSQYADTQWKLLTNDPITIGSTTLTFAQNFGVPYTASTVPPTANVVVGSQWFNTTTNVLYEYMYDGTSYYWIDLSGPAIGTNGAQAGTTLVNGTSNVLINDSGGNITFSIAGVSNIGVVNSTGLTVTGNITGSNLTIGGQAYNTAWTTYTPTWTSDGTQPTLGNGTLSGRYKQLGKTVFVRVTLTIGSSTNTGSGAWHFSLPVAAVDSQSVVMPSTYLDSGINWHIGMVNTQYAGSASTITPLLGSTPSGAVTASTPFTWNTSDSLTFNGSYESA